MRAMTDPTAEIVERVAADLEFAYGATYTMSPEGTKVAVLEWTLHPPRPRSPVVLLRYGSFCYDATRRAVVGRVILTGRMTIRDTDGGAVMAMIPGLVAGTPKWCDEGRYLAGLRPADDGHPLWILDTTTGTLSEPDVSVTSSLLGPHAGPPLWWAGGALLTLRDAIEMSVINPCDDIAAEPESASSPEFAHHDLAAIAGAARADLITIAGEILAEGVVVADCQLEGDLVAAVVITSAQQLAALLTDGSRPPAIRYRLHGAAPAGRQAPARQQASPARPPAFAERHDETGSALLHGTTVIHHIERSRAGLGSRRHDAALSEHAFCRQTEPDYPNGTSLVSLVPLEMTELPDIADLPALGEGTVDRCHLAAGTRLVTVYVLLPAGNAGYAATRDRFLTTVGILTERLGSSSLALAGTSFGAACAAMVLAHTGELFGCAILRSGAYNRTLTPRGFHHETRALWDARDMYDGFTFAYQARSILSPVLIEQGTADTNGATDVLQAWAFYDALLAAGRQARIALLYNEGHVTRTHEGVLTAAREELTWIQRHMLNPGRA